MSEYFEAANGEDAAIPVRILWDGQEGIIRLWMTDYPDVAITIDVVPEEDPEYMDKVYAQNLLIINLYNIIMDMVEGGAIKVTDLSGEAKVSDADIAKLMDGGYDAE